MFFSIKIQPGSFGYGATQMLVERNELNLAGLFEKPDM